MMSATRLNTFFRTSLVIAFACTVNCQQICSRKAYRYKGHCLPCPEHCKTCISSTNCTKCDDNNYGPFCQHACEDECTDQCHKEYGYCTYGCVDGRFPEKDSPRCPFCPSNCTLCKSSTECILCRHGYHGNSCQYPCARQCDKCDQRTGNCLMCAEGYLKIDGCCRRCPDGLDGCHDNIICYGCQEGYFRLGDGQCIMECPREESGLNKVSNSQDGFDLSNDQIAQNECMDAGTSQSVSFKTTTPCIRLLPCTGGIDCSSEDDDTGTCAAIMKYQCTHKCRPIKGSYPQCDHNCSTENWNTNILSFCNTGPVSIGNVSTTTECLPAPDDTDTASGLKGHLIHKPILVVIVVALCITIVMVVSCTVMYSRRRPMRKDTSEEETDIMLEMSDTGTVLVASDSLNTEPLQQDTTETPLINNQGHTGHTGMNKQEQSEEPTDSMMSEEITELEDSATRTDSLDMKPYQQDTRWTLEIDAPTNKQKHLQKSNNNMMTVKRIELKNNGTCAFSETANKVELPSGNTVGKRTNPEVNEGDGSPGSAGHGGHTGMNKQEQSKEPTDSMMSEEITELEDNATRTDSLDMKPDQQDTLGMLEVEPLTNKQKQTQASTNKTMTVKRNELDNNITSAFLETANKTENPSEELVVKHTSPENNEVLGGHTGPFSYFECTPVSSKLNVDEIPSQPFVEGRKPFFQNSIARRRYSIPIFEKEHTQYRPSRPKRYPYSKAPTLYTDTLKEH